ncbi:MAG TPA: VTT domain-containing protein [Ktedonobacterales bacterium]
MPSSIVLLQLANTYGYPLVVATLLAASAGLPLPAGMLLAALGALSALRQGPDLMLLLTLSIAACVVGDALDYAAGRYGVPALAGSLMGRRGARVRVLVANVSARLQRQGGPFIFITRFLLTPLASPTSLLAGASRLPLRRFLLWDAAGEAVFVLLYLILGRVVGATADLDDVLLPALMAAGALTAVLMLAPHAHRLLAHR